MTQKESLHDCCFKLIDKSAGRENMCSTSLLF